MGSVAREVLMRNHNEAYRIFKAMYGEKHAKQLIEQFTFIEEQINGKRATKNDPRQRDR